MRILHLLDPATCGDEGILACASAQHPVAYEVHHHTWIIGNAAAERRAWSLGIHTTDRVQPRGTMSGRTDALPGLRRLWNARRASLAPDVVQCWSLDALHLARECFRGEGAPARVALLPSPPPNDRRRPTASDLDLASGREVIGAFDEPTRRALAPLVGHPADAARWQPTIRLLDPPAFPPGGPIAIDRAAARESMGLEPDDVAVAWLADPPAAADCQHIAFAAGVLFAAGHATVSLVRRGARQERRAAAYMRTHGRRWGLMLVDASLPELLAAADVCVIEGHTCGPIAASLALSMGVPIATGPSTFLTDPNDPWPAQPGIPPGRIAVPLAAILEVPALRAHLDSAARAWCEELRERDGFRTTLHDLWAECAPNAAPSVSLDWGLAGAR